MPLLDVDDAVAELQHAAELGLHLVSLPTGVPEGHRRLEPRQLGAAVGGGRGGRHGARVPHRLRRRRRHVVDVPRPRRRGPQLRRDHLRRPARGHEARRVAARSTVTPTSRCSISEGGATWVPFIGDRMNEGYRQHGMFVRPTLSHAARRRSCTGRCTRRSSTTSRRRPRSGRWATTTCCGAATTRTSRAPSGTPRRRCTSSSTTSPRRSATASACGAFKELFPHVSDPPARGMTAWNGRRAHSGKLIATLA